MAPPPTGALYLRQQENVYVVRGMETLQQWIRERRVGAEDTISEDGVSWTLVSQIEHSTSEISPPILHTKPPEQSPFQGETGGFSLPNVPSDAWTDDDTEGIPVGLPSLNEEVSETPAQDPSSSSDMRELFDNREPTEDAPFMPPDDPTEPPVLVMVKTEPETKDPTPRIDVPLIPEEPFFDHDLTIPTEEAVAFADEIEQDWNRSQQRRKRRNRLILAAVLIAPPLLFAGYSMRGEAPPSVPMELALNEATPVQPEAKVDVPVDNAADNDVATPTEEAMATDARTEPIEPTPPEPTVAEPVVEPAPKVEAAPKPKPKPAPKAAPKPKPAPKAAPKPKPSTSNVGPLIETGWNMVEANPTQAAEQFRTALTMAPGNSEALYGLGYAYLGMNKVSEALDPLCKAIRSGNIEIQREIRGILSRKDLSCD